MDLFNGENLEGWKFFVENSAAKPGDVFSVKNGLIHIKGKPFGFMYTENKYSNFRLHVEWKYPIEGSNSGIFLFLQEPTKELWPNAVECQLCSGRAGDFVLLGGSDVSEYKAPEGILGEIGQTDFGSGFIGKENPFVGFGVLQIGWRFHKTDSFLDYLV